MYYVITLGLFPAIVNAFPAMDTEWLLNGDESLAIDYLLSFVCFAEVCSSRSQAK